MQVLVGYARSTFWTIGVVQILIGLYLVVALAARQHSASRTVAITLALVIVIGLLNIALGALSCLAARAWRHKKRFARPLVAINSAFNLIFFPFGTVAGAVGLFWCCSRRMREMEPRVEDFEFKSKPGDGTQAWMQKAASVMGVAVLLVSLAAAAWWGRAHGLPNHTRGIAGLILLLFCDWIVAFCHESGHAVAGWGVGMRLASFTVGPFVAQQKAGRWKFKFSPAAMLALGGSVVTKPLHWKDLRRRMAFEIAGGPVASILTALVAFFILLAMPGSPWEAWWQVPAVVAALSGAAAVLNLIPFGVAAGYSDGALLIQLLRGGPFADLREALKMMGSTTVTATRPRDVHALVLADGLRAGVGGPEEGVLQMVQLICALDRGELTLARKHLESSLQRIPAPEKAPSAGCAAEMAFYLAYLDGDASRARQWLQGAERLAVAQKLSLKADFDYWLAATAVREAEGLSREAEEAWQQAMHLAAKKPQFGLYEYERELLQSVRKGEWLRRPDAALAEALV